MIATRRLSPVKQVACVALAALVCYLVSQSVAAERAGLAKVNRQIVAEQDAIAKLSTEIATRGRLTQIESWNRQLALQAPRPGQYVESGVQLASLYARDAGPQLPLDPAVVAPHGPLRTVSLARQDAPPPTTAAAVVEPAPAAPPARVVPAVASARRPAPVPAAPRPLAARGTIQTVSFQSVRPVSRPHAAADLPPAQPLLRTAAFVRVAPSPLDEGMAASPAAFRLSSDIAGLARAEQARHKARDAK